MFSLSFLVLVAAKGGIYDTEPAARSPPPQKPPVPRRDEVPVLGLTSGKDFVVSNAVEAIIAPLRARKPKQAAEWLSKPGYGQVPAYLGEMRQAIDQERQLLQILLEQQEEQEKAAAPGMRELSSGERQELLLALKRKWDEVNQAYQLITFKNISASTASLGDIRWKEQCEQQLKQLEADINKLSVKAAIFVVDEGQQQQTTARSGAALESGRNSVRSSVRIVGNNRSSGSSILG
jgi:hypothetical protein